MENHSPHRQPSQPPYCTLPDPSSSEPVPEPSERTYTKAQAEAESARCLASVECTYCEVCQLLCPDMCITRDPETGHIVIDLDYCKGCGLCAYFCPKGALEMVEE